MERRRFLATVAGAAVTGPSVALAGCLGTADSGLAPGDYDVGMGGLTFEPARIEVEVGETVVWGNTSTAEHTVTAYGSRLPEGAEYFATGGYETQEAAADAFWERGEGVIAQGQTYEHAFEVPGEHHYYCAPHEAAGMVGVVAVE